MSPAPRPRMPARASSAASTRSSTPVAGGTTGSPLRPSPSSGESAPLEGLGLSGEPVVPPATGVEDRVLAADEARAGILGLGAGDILVDVPLVDPVLDGRGRVAELRSLPVHLALVELVVVDEPAAGFAQRELVPELAQRVLGRGLSQGRDPDTLELRHRGDELVKGGRDGDVRLGEHVLVVVDLYVLAIVRDAVPVPRAHDA